MAKILAYFNERIIGIVGYCNTGIIEQNIAYTGIINFGFSCFPFTQKQKIIINRHRIFDPDRNMISRRAIHFDGANFPPLLNEIVNVDK